MIRHLKVVLRLILVVFLPTSLGYSQTIDIHAGFVISNLQSAKMGNTPMLQILDNYKNKVGPTIGVSSEFKVTKNSKFSISPQLKYAQLGARYNLFENMTPYFNPINPFSDPALQYYNLTKSINMHYIQFPLLMNYKLDERFDATIGGQLSYLLSYKAEHFEHLVGGAPSINKFGYGTQVGLSYSINEKISSSVNFYLGISEVEEVTINNPQMGASANGTNRLNYLSLEANYKLRN